MATFSDPRDSVLNKPKPVIHLDKAFLDRITKGVEPYPIQEGKKYEYGTAGFRMKAPLLDHVIYTVGLIAALRSKKRNATIGIMITASHNPAEDNGVKLVDPLGDMLEQSWEGYATTLANTPNDKLAKEYEILLNETLISNISQVHERQAKVVFARDTRASGPYLVTALKAALDAVNVEYKDYGIMTTPQLHYIVRCVNTLNTPYHFGEPTEKGYYEKMAKAFKTLMHGRTIQGPITVDCANGVGGPKLRELIKYLPTAKEGGIDFKIVNDDVVKPEALNFECGADYVKTKQRAPPHSIAQPRDRCCSLDGDADRVVYYYTDEQKTFHLLDGDRIATLGAVFLADMTRVAGLDQKLKIGIVQTAYANGAATEYVEKVLKLPVTVTPTGVKHLHHAAARYDIGVYFEANGHGTVLFSDNAIKLIRESEPKSPGQKHALDSLSACIDLINQAVGDAISDMLFAEVVLAHKSWTPENWRNTYIDLPNRLVRVVVHDRSIFKAVDAERKLESPAGAQIEIEKLCQLYMKARAFARASGTEDAVRVYAEAYTQTEVEKLAGQVAEVVRKYGVP
ncbi:Phosphoacetylglucosamine Mutase [Cladophialophora chaetospira]|uniref:Phosphoacetylglucosamine mutase n=1 Tax=Cladophialophora chaetospira TaxID=386627 RepID=A0AA38XC38_9EURO|nr:Phosphoacetylglucosamine Mutase [Cladophialophora chaetospira]